MNIANKIYSKETEKELQVELAFAVKKGWITIHEWRNYIDLSVIPLIRKHKEEALADVRELIDSIGHRDSRVFKKELLAKLGDRK